MQVQRVWASLGLVAGVWALSGVGCGSERGSGFDPDGDDAGGTSGQTSSGGGGSSGTGIVPGSSSGDGGSSSGGATCATATSVAERQPVYLDIILDGSGSMDAQIAVCKSDRNTYCATGSYIAQGSALECLGEYGVCRATADCEADPVLAGRQTGKKWIATRDSLTAYVNATAAVASPALGVGLYAFSLWSQDEPLPQTAIAPLVEPVAVLDAAHATQMLSHVAPPLFPLGGTPLGSSVEAQTAYLRGFQAESPLLPDGRRVILLITDGIPGVNGDPSETKARLRTAVQQAVEGSPEVAVAVIGVGDPAADPDTTYDAAFLSSLAKLGGLAAEGCDESWAGGSGTPCHLQVTPGAKTADQIKDEMSAAIDAIAGSVASCTLGLDKSSPIDPAKVNVIYVDGTGAQQQLPQDPANGWTYDDPANPSQVILHGTACSQLQGSTDGRVDIVVGCPTGTSVVN